MPAAWYEADLNRLVTLLNTLAHGGLAIALCEDRSLQDAIMSDLRPRLTRPLYEFTLSPDANDPIALLHDSGAKPGDVACFYELEAGGEAALKRLEWRREAVWDFEVNLLFWVTGEGQRRLLADAPNFYSRRTLLVQFTSPALEVVTLMCVDVAESSWFLHELGDLGYWKLASAFQDELLSKMIPEFGGRVVYHLGDSSLAIFSSAIAAVACAVAVQRRLLAGAIETPKGPLQVRIGLHTGTPHHVRDGLEGSDVYKTMDLTMLGSGGQILLSAETYALVRDRGNDVTFYAHGAVSLSSLREPQGVYKVLGPQEIYEILWEGRYPRPLRSVQIPTNLPPRQPGFIGHRAALERIASLLDEGKRIMLTSETGLAGIGKTALALEAAHSAYAARRFPGGAAWVSLEDNPPFDRVLVTVAQALSLIREDTPSPAELRARLDAHLHRAPCLLVLDGAEAAATNTELWQWVNTLPPSTAILITTRKRLPLLTDGQVEKVDGLPPRDAVALFVARVRQRLRNWSPDGPESENLISRIVEFCGGVPLASELVAAWVGKASLQEIVDSLAQTIPPTSEQSLRRILDWGYRRLDASTQSVFVASSLFVGSFTAEAITAVCDVLDAQPSLDRLQEISLLQRIEVNWRTRYTLHHLIRPYAAEKLSALEILPTVRQRFVAYYRQWIVDNHDVNKPDQLAILDAEWRNALAASKIAEELRDWRSVIELSEYLGELLLLRGLWSEREQLNQRALAAARALGDRRAEGRAFNNLGLLYENQGRWAEAETAYQQDLAICREFGDRAGEGQTLNNLGNVYDAQGWWEEAEKAYQESLAIYREYGDRFGEGQTLNNLGNVYGRRERWAEAEAAYQQSLAICRELGDRAGEGHAFNNLGELWRLQNRWVGAEGALQQSLLIWRELGHRAGEAGTLNNLGNVYTQQGRWTEAEQAYQQSLVISREIGDRVGEGEILANFAELRAAQGDLAGALELGRQAITVLETTENTRTLAEARELVAKWERQVAEQEHRAEEQGSTTVP